MSSFDLIIFLKKWVLSLTFFIFSRKNFERTEKYFVSIKKFISSLLDKRRPLIANFIVYKIKSDLSLQCDTRIFANITKKRKVFHQNSIRIEGNIQSKLS